MTCMRMKPLFLTLFLVLSIAGPAAAKDAELLNVSYDPTRELY